MKLNVVIFKHHHLNFEKIKEDDKCIVYSLNSLSQARHHAFSYLPDGWVCFFDHDCYYNSQLIQQILEKTKNLSTDTIVAGSYKDIAGSSYLQRLHNLIANAWLKASSSENAERFLGGFFVINVQPKVRQHVFIDIPKWGGEEVVFAEHLIKLGYHIKIDSDLHVDHKTSGSLFHFIKRAWLHGWNQKSNVQGFQKTNQYWQNILRKQPWPDRLGCYLHFSILILAGKIQKFLRGHKKQTSSLK